MKTMITMICQAFEGGELESSKPREPTTYSNKLIHVDTSTRMLSFLQLPRYLFATSAAAAQSGSSSMQQGPKGNCSSSAAAIACNIIII